MDIKEIISCLGAYDGRELTFMEVCGTHTAAISENAIPSLLSDKIRLISGPGCPVCVTASSYIDRLCELALRKNTCILTFGDLIRVPSARTSLQEAKAMGARVQMVYSPFEIIKQAQSEPSTQFIFAAVGFETTTPIYALLMEKITELGIENIKFLTALKTMPRAIDKLCESGARPDGFIAPGNVSVITGAAAFEPLAKKYNLPFVISGFSAEELLGTIYALTRLQNQGKVLNLYKTAVTHSGNEKAKTLVHRYFEPCSAYWRGIGTIEGSGLSLREEFKEYDAGSRLLTEDEPRSTVCRCGDVITGRIHPNECPLFKKICTPQNPQGACMVSNEGSCFHYYINNR